MGSFREPNFKAQVTRSDVGLTETALFCHPDKIIPGIGPLEQNMPECPPGHPGIEPAASAPLHILIDFIDGCDLRQVGYQRLTSGTQDTVYFIQCTDGFGKILEGRRAIDEIKRGIGKRHR